MRDDLTSLGVAPDLLDPSPRPIFGSPAWHTLPVSARVCDHLADILVALGAIKAELQTEEANGLLWIEPHIDRVFEEVDRILQRLAA